MDAMNDRGGNEELRVMGVHRSKDRSKRASEGREGGKNCLPSLARSAGIIVRPGLEWTENSQERCFMTGHWVVGFNRMSVCQGVFSERGGAGEAR